VAAAAAKDDGDAAVMLAKQSEREAVATRQQKRRRLLKSFREYTVRQSDEGKFKGWSKRAADEMTSYCKKLKVEGEQERAKVFFAAY
jgi:hypothetical protein